MLLSVTYSISKVLSNLPHNGEDALINNTDIETSSEVEENDKRRMLVKDTDIGKRLIGEIDDLHKLLENYRRL